MINEKNLPDSTIIPSKKKLKVDLNIRPGWGWPKREDGGTVQYGVGDQEFNVFLLGG
jgi:hypothetical protein